MKFNPGDILYSNSDVNVRNSASTSGTVLQLISAGKPIGQVVEGYTEKDGVWYSVMGDSSQGATYGDGWVKEGDYLRNTAKAPSGTTDKPGTKADETAATTENKSGSSMKGVITIIGIAIAAYGVWYYFIKSKKGKAS